jgi:lecithin:retinol acyltransferase
MGYGDHVFVKRLGYTHHGVEAADRMVIHFTGTPGSKRGAAIRSEAMDLFADGGRVAIQEYDRRLDPPEAVARAESKIGQCDYNLYRNNCEHFARWCVTGHHRSRQVNGANATGGVVTVTAGAAAGGVGVITTIGEVAGLSASGIMSGLASAGGVVGAGAVGGLVVLGAVPAVLSAAIINVALRDDAALPSDERSARGVGRKASIVGAIGGSATGIGAVSVLGTAGLSAAGISSGLATIGAVVGGGMAAGSAIVIAGPAIAAAGLGYGAYRVVRRVRRGKPRPGQFRSMKHQRATVPQAGVQPDASCAR